jgi:hypothetical protein
MENIVLLLILLFCGLGGVFMVYGIHLCSPRSVPHVVPGAQPTTTVRNAGASEATMTTTVTYTMDQPLAVIRIHYVAQMAQRCVEGTIQTRTVDTPMPSYSAHCMLGTYDGAESAHTFSVVLRAVAPAQTHVTQEDLFATGC